MKALSHPPKKMATAVAMRYARAGPIAHVLKREAVPVARLARPTDALVKLLHAPLHRSDASVINGTAAGRVYSAASAPPGVPQFNLGSFPRTGGAEGLGKVLDPGTAEGVKAGDLIWIPPMVGTGTWATHAVVDTSKAVIVDAETQKQLPLELLSCATGLITAHRLFSKTLPTALKSGDTIVQNAGSSLVSVAIAALAKANGVTVITGANEERLETARKVHAAFGSLVVSSDTKGAREAKAKMGGSAKARAFFNGSGGASFNAYLKLLADGGHCVTYGAQNGFGLMWSGSHHFWRDVTISGINTPRYLLGLTKEQRAAALRDAVVALSAAKFSFPIVAASLDQFEAAWDDTVREGGGRKRVLSL